MISGAACEVYEKEFQFTATSAARGVGENVSLADEEGNRAEESRR